MSADDLPSLEPAQGKGQLNLGGRPLGSAVGGATNLSHVDAVNDDDDGSVPNTSSAVPNGKPTCFIWTSTLKASTETAGALPLRPPRIALRALNRIKVGRFAGLSVEEFRSEYPAEYAERERDRLNFRFPEGESYLDLAQRLQPAIIELERIKSPVVIISHRSVLRVLRNYFTGSSMEDMPYMQVSKSSVLLESSMEDMPYMVYPFSSII
jgi:6-phosphofructo-2-kinase/fructose-2,6-biphosphatase